MNSHTVILRSTTLTRTDQRGYLLVAVAMVLTVIAVLGLISNRESIIGTKRISGESETLQATYVAQAGMEHAAWVANLGSCSGYVLPTTPFGADSYSAQFSPPSGSPITIAATGTLASGVTRTLVAADTPVFQAPIVTTHQPDAAQATDTFVDALNPSWDHGVQSTLRVRGGGTPRHSLLHFDLDTLPIQARLISAVLELSSNSIAGSGAVSVHRVTNGWSEGTASGSTGSGASWDDRVAGEPWITAGGDYDAAAIATTVVAAPTGSWHQWDVTALFAAWISGGVINNGLILVPADTSINAEFRSSDDSNAALHPRLVLTYACECGVGSGSGSDVFQPGSSAKDSYIIGSDANANYGAQPELRTHAAENGPTPSERTLIQFDLSSLPPGVQISSAILELYQSEDNGDAHTVEAYRLTRDWTEGNDSSGSGVSFNSYDGTNNWTTPGGDYDNSVVGSFVATGSGWKSLDLSGLAQDWHSSAVPNYGVILLSPPTGGNNEKIYVSSDSAAATNRPKLTVNYSCPCGVDCLASGPSGTYCDADFEANANIFDFDWMPGTGEVTGIDFLPEDTIVNGVTVPAGGGWIMTDRNKEKFFVTDTSGNPLTEFVTGAPDPRGIAYVKAGSWAGHLAVADKSDDAIYFIDLNGVIQGSFPTTGITTDPYGLSFIGETAGHVYDDHLAISSNKNGTDDNVGAVYIVDQGGVLKKTIDVDSHAPFPRGVAHLTGDDKFMVADRDSTISIINFTGTVLNQYDSATWAYGELHGVTIHPSTCDHVVIDKKVKKIGGFNVRAQAGGGNPKLLMVVANDGNLTTQEQAKRTLFEFWGYIVNLIDDSASAGDYDNAVAVNDVAFVGEDISASKLDSELADAKIGVVNEEINLSDEFGLSTTIGWNSGSALDIDDNSHTITSPFAMGSLDILGSDSDLAYLAGTLAPDLRLLGSTAAGPMLVALEAGGETFNTLPAAGRRVQLPWGESNFELDNLTTEGETILRRALAWGVQPPPRCDADFVANNLLSDFPWMAGTADIHGIDYLPAGLVVNSVTIPAGGGWIMSDRSKDRLFVTDLAGNPLTDFAMLPFDSQGVALIDAGPWIHHLAVADKSADTQRVFYLDLDGDIVWSFFADGITTDPLGLSFVGATASGGYDNHLAISSNKNLSGGGTATVFIVDQSGNLKKTIDVESFAPTPQGVTHLTGADKLLITDKNGLVSIIDFDGILLRQYSAANLGLYEINDVTLNPMTCEHVIVEKDFEKINMLESNVLAGGGPRYIEMYVPWNATAPDDWESIALGVFGVPSNAVVEVAVVNTDGGKELWGGVRAMGSTLQRRLQLHEADGGGVDAMVMHAQTDSAGRIEHYSDDPDKLSFVLLGYWTESAYAENWQVFKAGASGSWQTHALNTYGVGSDDVAEFLLVNNDGFFEHQAGLRTDGSSLSRIVNLHEAKDGGDEGMTLFGIAGSDSGATVELYAEDNIQIDFYLLGHWTTPPGSYTSAYTDLGTASVDVTWEDADLGSHGVAANAVAQIALVNSEDGNEAFLGIRANGSLMSRWLEVHQSKNGGDDLAAMHVSVDSGSGIQWYDDDTLKIHRFYLLGWWTLF